MAKALNSNGSRILTVNEADAIRAVISKPSNRALFDLLLYTGMRFIEVKQLFNNHDIFDPDRRTITITSGKVKATQGTRNIMLGDKGVEAVKAYLNNPKAITSSTAWQMNLIRWCRKAGITPLQGSVDMKENIYGITVRTSRKTWESWLLMAYPDKLAYITLSQGHNEMTSIRHYLNLSFTAAEREDIVREVAGWVSGKPAMGL